MSKSDKLYGVSEVYTLKFKDLSATENGRKHAVMEVYEESIRFENLQDRFMYVGEGYTFGDFFVRHGKGLEFWSNGTLRYDGSFMHGEACGHGTSYYSDGTMQYCGDFWMGCWHGMGRSYCENGKLHFEGSFYKGIAEGQTRCYYESGILCYEGEAKQGQIHGKGRKYNEDGGIYYEGSAVYGKPCGFGRLYHANGNLCYEGEIHDMKYHGHGREYNEDGVLIYEGHFNHDVRCGEGRCYDGKTGQLISQQGGDTDDDFGFILGAEDDAFDLDIEEDMTVSVEKKDDFEPSVPKSENRIPRDILAEIINSRRKE